VAAPLRELQSESIGVGEIHVWLADLAGLPGPGVLDRNVLDPAELDRAARYTRPRDSARFAASRACLRVILGSYLDKDPADLRFAASPSGRPALAGDNPGKREFSLSRSGDLALIAVSLTPVGADIEIVRPRAGLADVIASRFSAGSGVSTCTAPKASRQ